MKTLRYLIAFSLVLSAMVCTTEARTTVPKFPIMSSAGPNGKIKPAGTVQAKQGSSKTFTATPAKGFKGAILLDGSFVVIGTAQAPVKFTLSGITAPHTIEARFVTLSGSFMPPPPPTSNVNISIIGFGKSPTVSDHTPVTIGGLAGSDVGLQAVQGLNVSTNASISVNGTTNWSASVPLKIGDNVLRFTSVATDGNQSQIQTTITYYPGLDFTTALEASENVLFVGSANQVNFTIGIKNTAGAVLKLFQTDVNGMPTDAGTQMFDDGVLPDEIQSDGIFTAGVLPDTSTTGFHYFRVGVTRNSATFFSEVLRIWVTGHLSNGQVDLSVGLGNTAQQTYTNATNQGQSPAQAAATTLAALQSNPNVGVAGMTPEHGVWWVSADGLLGFFHTFLTEQKAGIRGATPPSQIKAGAGGVEKNGVPPQIKYYKNVGEEFSASRPVISGTLGVLENRIKSRKGIIISPFINNPLISNNNFGTKDDYFGPWQIVKNAGVDSCSLYAATEIVNNGSLNVTHQSFVNVGDFGYIHESSHGDNLYNGLFSLWEDVWGPNDFLRGSSSQVIILSGEFLSQNPDGSWNLDGFEEDIKAHRLAIGPSGQVAMLPEFFDHYLPALPNSLVILSSCRSTYNNSMASVFLSSGAGSVIGFSDYVKTSYAQNTLTTFLGDLYQDKTVLDAALDAIAQFGPNDGDDTPAAFTLYGDATLKLADSNLHNGGFEDGTLLNWSPEGDGRVIRQLGSTFPTEGAFMGIISTGLGFIQTNGSIRQDFCIPANATTLNFDWNFFSEEFLEFCGSIFQDFFNVTLYELDSNGIPVNSHLLFHRQIDDLCCCVTLSDVHFDQDGAYTTGWLTSNLDISAYAGEHVTIEFSTGNEGDNIYATAVLLDRISITSPAP